jgi:hypothetical protein
MSKHMNTLNWFVALSNEQQELLSGGQNGITIGNTRVPPLGRALQDGSETVLSTLSTRGTTTSGPTGSLGNSVGQGKGTATGAQDSMILPPFTAVSEVLG